jgi:hypothetical protein
MTVFLDDNRMMSNFQKHNICTKEGCGFWWSLLLLLVVLVLVGRSSLYLQLLRFLISRVKSGVASLCSVMVEMTSHLGSYWPASGRIGRCLCCSHVDHIKNLHFNLLFINALIYFLVWYCYIVLVIVL